MTDPPADEDSASTLDGADETRSRPSSTLLLNLERWLPWAGMAMVAAATWQTLSLLIRGVFDAWAFVGFGTIVYPNGYYSLALLAGVLLMVWTETRGAASADIRWLRAACRLTVASGVLLVVTQVIAAVNALFYINVGLTSGNPLPPLPGGVAARGTTIFNGLGALGDAVPAALAVGIAAVLLHRWDPVRSKIEQKGASALTWQRSTIVAGSLGVAVYVVLAILMQAGGRSHQQTFYPFGTSPGIVLPRVQLPTPASLPSLPPPPAPPPPPSP